MGEEVSQRCLQSARIGQFEYGPGKWEIMSGREVSGPQQFVGPLHRPNAEVIVVASSFQQASITHSHIVHFLKPFTEAEPKRYRIWNTANYAQVKDLESGTVVRCAGSDPKRMSGWAPSLVIAEELASWLPNRILAALAILKDFARQN